MIFSRCTLGPAGDEAGDDLFSTSPADFVLRFTIETGTGSALEGLPDAGDAELVALQ